MVGEKEITFYDKKDLVLGLKRVTLRLAREQGDKYEELRAGNHFILNIPKEENQIDDLIGTILAHWKLSFQSIPPQFLAGEGYKLDLENKMQSTKQILRDTARKDLGGYYEMTDESLIHVIVYLPMAEVDRDILQKSKETPQEWLARCEEDVFGNNPSYIKLMQESQSSSSE